MYTKDDITVMNTDHRQKRFRI